MAGTVDFAGMVPGLDFLQTLMKSAATASPPMGQWIAPTLDPADLEKRINELRTVQFWLEQNAKLLGASIQALEVQRMTLATLHSMNLPMTDLRDALKIRPAPVDAGPTPSASSSAATSAAAAQGEAAAAQASPANPSIDPLQWWGALTKQFTDIAAKTLQQGAAEAASMAAAAPLPTAETPAARAGKAAAQRAPVPAPTPAAKRPRRGVPG